MLVSESLPLRTTRRALTVLAVAAATLAPAVARADSGMDPTPERLVLQPPNLPPGQTCQSIAGDPASVVAAGQRPQDFSCAPDNLGFRNYISEMGFAIAPSAFHPARTTGVGGFALTVDASYTRISPGRASDSGQLYWHNGTRGSVDPNSNRTSIVNNDPDSILQIYTLKARKGLPFGFEGVGALGYMANTSLWVVGGDLRWALMEGFRTGALGLLPDVSIGGGVRTLTGTSKFYLTTAAVDVKLSKPIPLADSAELTVHVGFQRLFIFGDSGVVDSTPNVDPLAQCGWNGVDPQTGAPTCRNKLPNGADASTDFSNNFTFDRVRLHRNRGLFGLTYRYEFIHLGSQIAFDISAPKENPGIVGPRQWTLSFEGGVHF